MPATMGSIALAVSIFLQPSLAGYTLMKNYTGAAQFFGSFEFFSQADPTSGFVQFADQATASAKGVAGTVSGSGSEGAVYLGVDYTDSAPNGRLATRVNTNDTFNHGLFIADISHMPEGCATWPAMWLLGTSANWPNAGEIDILEGVNQNTNNQMTLHTNAGCTINDSGFTGKVVTSDCNIAAQGQATNAGCGISDATDSTSYGSAFNAQQGGVYATEWTSDYIRIWYFGRDSIPADIENNAPDPSGWGNPVANFAGSCDIDQHFNDMQIIFDTTLCGQWAGAVWNTSSCASLAPTCEEYVQNNPSAFQNAYWAIDRLTVWGQGQTNRRRAGGATLPI